MMYKSNYHIKGRAIKAVMTLLFVFSMALGYGNPKQTVNNTSLNKIILEQASIMGRAFVKADYQVFVKYTYPAIVSAMGGNMRMSTVLGNSASSMKAQGMTLEAITFDPPSKVIKSGNELQSTLQQHTSIKLSKGRMVVTSTLIAISNDGGRNWFFVDTSNKDIGTMRKVLPNLSADISIPPQPKPVYSDF